MWPPICWTMIPRSEVKYPLRVVHAYLKSLRIFRRLEKNPNPLALYPSITSRLSIRKNTKSKPHQDARSLKSQRWILHARKNYTEGFLDGQSKTHGGRLCKNLLSFSLSLFLLYNQVPANPLLRGARGPKHQALRSIGRCQTLIGPN